METHLSQLDRQQLGLIFEHVVTSADVVQRCTRDLEHVVRQDDPHPMITTSTVYNRLAVVAARLVTAHEQLAALVGRAEQLVQEQRQLGLDAAPARDTQAVYLDPPEHRA